MSADLELAVEAEVVEPLDRAAASRIDQRIRLFVGTINDNIVKLRELVDKAKRGHVHLKTVHLFQVEHRNRSPAWTARRTSGSQQKRQQKLAEPSKVCRPLSMQGVCNMGASLGLVPARGVRALSRATVTTAVVCGGLAIASGHPAQADDPTVLTGTYRLYFDGNGSTVDSVPVAHTSDTYLYAFRSACLAGGCVANGTRLGPDPDQKAISAPGSEVGAFPRKVNLRFTDGSWVMSAPYGRPCGDGGQGSWMTEWSLTPQQKGVMTGIRKDSPAGALCPGDGGGYLTEPMTATRERNVDPGVDVTAPT